MFEKPFWFLPLIFCTYGISFSVGISIKGLKKSFKEGPFFIFLIGFWSIARSVALTADACEGMGIVSWIARHARNQWESISIVSNIFEGSFYNISLPTFWNWTKLKFGNVTRLKIRQRHYVIKHHKYMILGYYYVNPSSVQLNLCG